MLSRFTKFILVLAISSSAIFAQTTTVTLTMDVLGVSPRDVAKSTTDIYTFASTGLKNVGIGSIMYFKATITGQKFANPTWTITRRPSGSATAVAATKHIIDEYNQVVYLTPDKLGAYEVTVTDGSFTKTVTFNATKYLGYENTVVEGVDRKVNCNTCHSSVVTKWKTTGHATMFTRAMNGTPGLSGPADHYASYCVPCHTTGYDANPTAKNDGFDDLTFTYPTVLGPGGFDKLVTAFPAAMQRANIQCESCHGPAGSHVGATTDMRIQATYNADVCAYCHDSGTHHIFPEQWDASYHSGATSYPTGAGRESCVRCHTGAGFAQYSAGIPTTDPYFDVSYSPISCAGCHDPHSKTNVHQLRKVTAEIYNPNSATPTAPTYKAVTGAGMGTMCINCHQSRAEANASVAATSISSRFGPHYGPQGDILLSSNMLELGGVKLAVSNHLGAAVDACVRCHMYNLNALTGSVVNQWGGHSFSMSTFKKDASGNYLMGPDHRRIKDKDNMEACAQCHGSTFGTNFEDVKFYLNGSGDHDNNGKVEGLHQEVFGMVNKIMSELGKIPGSTFSPEYGQYDATGKFIAFPVPKATWTKTQLSAYWNAITAHNDKSGGIHNPKYIITGLKGAMKSLGLATAVEQETEVPSAYTLYQNYPNPFNPTTMIKFALPKSGHVKLTIYDALGQEVQTLVNDQLVAGTHNIEWTAKNMASGIYLYRIEAGNFVKVNKMLLVK
ncbi:MAG: hypothetical protein CVV24_13740 [Ignavibacteriae bacterium HGW-Ignavibacteriae-3]|nr:MAG: hypothetical protein CVV24_13740 [Ignavibacteriae bacterium HGW-Ignavibacteriae-3]